MLVRAPQDRLAEYEEPARDGGTPAQPAGDTLLVMVWRRRWTVLAITLLCLSAAFVYLLKATPIYTSSSRLYVEQSGPRVMSDQQTGAPRSASFLYTQSELVASTPILTNAIDAANFKSFRTFANVDNPLVFLKKELKVGVGKKDDLITVSFDSPDPVEAAAVVNSVVEAYASHVAKQKKSSAAEVLQILQREKANRDRDRDEKVKQMLAFKEANGALSFESEKGNVVTQQLRLSDALTTAQLEVVDAKAAHEVAKVAAEDPNTLRELIQAQQQSKGVYMTLQTQEGELRKNIAQLEMQLSLSEGEMGPSHKFMARSRRALENLKAQLAEMDTRFADAYLGSTSQRLDTALQKQEELQRAVDEQKKTALDLNSKSIQYTLLDSELKRLERQGDLLDARIREINVNEDAGVTNISILEVARPEELPSKPRKTLVVAAALMLGLMLGVGGALARDTMDHRLRSAEEVTAVLNVPVLGVVPHMPEKLGLVARGQKSQLEPMSDVAEAYRAVRTAVYFGVPSGECKTILVTSPMPGDGKSTSASNLSIVMAQAGQRVLLIDADFRKPTQHKVFDLAADKGVSSVVAGQATFADAVRTMWAGKLDVLPCGPLPPNPSELLNGQAFADLLGEVSGRYDYVVIDSPPVLAVTDARILAAICDTTLLVLRANKSTRRVARQARDALAGIGARVLGAVVNDVNIEKGGYGYGYGYYGYGYGRDNSAPAAPARRGGLRGGDGERRLLTAGVPAPSGGVALADEDPDEHPD